MHAKNKELIVQELEGGLPMTVALLRSPDRTLQEHSAVIIRNISVNEENEVRKELWDHLRLPLTSAACLMCCSEGTGPYIPNIIMSGF
jgi:hypothetical protein